MSVRLVEVTRSGLVESVHNGSIAVVDSSGKLKYGLGNTDRLTFFHSSAKPLQAIAALEAGAAEEFDLDLKEIAIMMSSHSGEKEHIEVLNKIIDKLGIEENELECGIAEPVNKEVLKELYSAGLVPSSLHCNCSGKHLGFIAASKLKGFPIEGYYKPEHPLQKLLTGIISDFSRIDAQSIICATDGCGVPVYALPLKNMALAYANLCDPDFMDGRYKKSQNYILSAMTMYPEMVAGRGRLDTELMKRFGHMIIGKAGAEGVYCIGLTGEKTGIAIKIDDGSQRAIGSVVIEVLLQLGVLDAGEARQMKDFWKPEILNNRKEKVGEIRAIFEMA